MAHTLEFARKCEPGIPIDSIEIWKTSITEIMPTGPGQISVLKCENHWTIIFMFGSYRVIASKHRGYDLYWHQFFFTPPSVVLKFEPLHLCPPMDDLAYTICAAENPNTKALDCSSFVFNFIMTHVDNGHIRGSVDELREHLYTSPGAASAEQSRAMA